MSDFKEKIKSVGGVNYIGQIPTGEKVIVQDHTLEVIQNEMGILPDGEIIKFISDFGYSRFNKNVFAKTLNKSDFLKTGKVAIGTLYGWTNDSDGIRDVIGSYHQEDQLNVSFFPLSEGNPGDLIYYSLKEESFGKIFYWHHESNLDTPDTLIANSLIDFIDSLFVEEEEEEQVEPLSDEELERVNANRRKIGLPPINKYKNVI